jgi:hypothetical protein
LFEAGRLKLLACGTSYEGVDLAAMLESLAPFERAAVASEGWPPGKISPRWVRESDSGG